MNTKTKNTNTKNTKKIYLKKDELNNIVDKAFDYFKDSKCINVSDAVSEYYDNNEDLHDLLSCNYLNQQVSLKYKNKIKQVKDDKRINIYNKLVSLVENNILEYEELQYISSINFYLMFRSEFK